ncbi:M15 family metallopeptidase [Nocardia pseudobrasiliensis]|uniref:D-alanyl-D-alanine dipeptidase n=1 Tax=Nocardia pseudobrasiliensis TaxID=45979 RepID=A0A370HS38_9NOCA|nr:M15 family metallopeptidase [Nocardia pseudobrasiliensis]RDI61353.1 D-Ala-D-Ala dipeptidase VanX [Nocardia pseudobrasiliensis]
MRRSLPRWVGSLTLICVVGLGGGCADPAKPRPSEADFVSVTEADPSILVDARYFGEHNFIGSRINGYEAPKCLLTKQAAAALAEVQRELRPMNLSLKTYDCYRPQRAVDQFVSWARDLGDMKMKQEFYPTVDKSNLFRDGYIAEKSGHTRGSTVDLTIVALPAPTAEQYHPGDALRECVLPAEQRFHDDSLDFGTGFDCFDPAAHTANPAIGGAQRGLRALLSDAMADHGFKNLPEEWWHFTLRDEPFPDTYFDFPVH